MRGSLDLSSHKLAGLFRPPAPRSGWRRAKLRKRGDDAAYRQIWRIVDGAVRDAFANHPEYLTPRGQRMAREAVIKRVTGALHGYATQVAMGRSGTQAPAADAVRGAVRTPSILARLGSKARLWWRTRSATTKSNGGAA